MAEFNPNYAPPPSYNDSAAQNSPHAGQSPGYPEKGGFPQDNPYTVSATQPNAPYPDAGNLVAQQPSQAPNFQPGVATPQQGYEGYPPPAGPPHPGTAYPPAPPSYPPQQLYQKQPVGHVPQPGVAYGMQQPLIAQQPMIVQQPMIAQQQIVTTIPSTTVVMANVPNFGPFSCQMICPSCKLLVSTRLEYDPGACAWLICLIICVMGGWMCCCLIPFFVQSCQDVVHMCPNCKRKLGSYKRL